MLSELFWTTAYTAFFAFIIAMTHFCYRSKCSKVKICCIEIERNVSIEEEIDLAKKSNETDEENNLSSV
jgi:hypothetical protein